MAQNKGEAGEEEDNIGIYMGRRNKDGERHGEGWAVLPNGDFYQGCYCQGMRNGKGLYVFMKSGARYEGDWRKHMKYGVGLMTYPDGSRYEGDWRNDLKQGFGAYYYPNGDVYEGAWFKGKRHGLGIYFHATTQTKFMGTWVEGVIEGPGQIMYPHHRFHGSWTRGMAKGPGSFVFDMNCMLHGFYLLVKEQEEQFGEGEEEHEKEREKEEAFEEDVEIDETLGKKPMWRARNVTSYMAELLPPGPEPLPVHDSMPSLSECSLGADTMQFDAPSMYGEEAQHDDDSWLLHRQQFLEETQEPH